jgi:hypothetical protein
MAGGNSLVRAAVVFTFRVLSRSAPHRIALAVGAAGAIAFTMAAMRWGSEPTYSPAGVVPLKAWMLQTMVLASLLAAFRHCVRTPAELRANWIFVLCWPAEIARFLDGVQRAAMVAVVLPAIVILLPVHLVRLGTAAAVTHSLTGLAMGWLGLTLLVRRRHLPFASSDVPQQSLASVGPIVVLVTVVVAALLAWIERAASASTVASLIMPVMFLLAGSAVRVLDAKWSAGETGRPEDAFDTSPHMLGLHN